MRNDGALRDEELTRAIIGAFFRVYNELQYGFLERVYGNALTRVLERSGHAVAREARAAVWFEGEIIGSHRLDMIVDAKVVVEIKATERLSPIADRQLRSYLRATGLEVGLLLHFGPEARIRRVHPGKCRAVAARISRESNGHPHDLEDPPDPVN
jgi:GxxExxY protein